MRNLYRNKINRLRSKAVKRWLKMGISPGTIEFMEAVDVGREADAHIAELESELAEQARLNGMGSEREAAKDGRIAEQQHTIDHLLDLIEDLDRAVSVRHKDIDDLEQIDAAVLRMIQAGEAAQQTAEDTQ